MYIYIYIVYILYTYIYYIYNSYCIIIVIVNHRLYCYLRCGIASTPFRRKDMADRPSTKIFVDQKMFCRPNGQNVSQANIVGQTL